MRGGLVVFNLLLPLLANGCGQAASSQVDVGRTYVRPAGTENVVLTGETYGYVATTARAQQVAGGFARLTIGQSRQQVRALLGAPDFAQAARPRGSDRFLGWHYIYYLRKRHSQVGWADSSDIVAEVFFDPGTNQASKTTATNIPGATSW